MGRSLRSRGRISLFKYVQNPWGGEVKDSSAGIPCGLIWDRREKQIRTFAEDREGNNMVWQKTHRPTEKAGSRFIMHLFSVGASPTRNEQIGQRE